MKRRKPDRLPFRYTPPSKAWFQDFFRFLIRGVNDYDHLRPIALLETNFSPARQIPSGDYYIYGYRSTYRI